ncbi:2-oxo acid dehydrogenase subunit E2 [Kribbella sp. NBC_00709]|uniref:dihydrolipoamide acetyltransferase family protein n=1 Tax=Kribbella sp. NBC_00709 TaxID=2975972 RepID=UPI002E2C6CC4|nr:dihydrolipoamide acetyltransferase family protein [Kribbella sp. NBC_00709]
MNTFLLPDLGEGLTEAEVVRWLVKVGDVVAVDTPVAEVETAKSIVELPSPYAGVIEELHGEPGTTIPVGKPLITVTDQAGEAYREEERAGSGNVLVGYGTTEISGAGRRRKPRSAVSGTLLPDSAEKVPQKRVPLVISPLVRRLARDAEVDLRALDGSGPDGLIVRRDVELAIARRTRIEPEPVVTQQPAPRTGLPELRRTPMSGFRKAVVATLTRSRAEIPEATTWVDVDATALMDLRASLRSATDPGPGLLALMARFVVAGLLKYPELNGYVDTAREELVQYDGVNLGLAAQTDRGLVVPAVANAHALTTRGLDAEIRRLTESARDGRLTQQELTSGTFTLNNYGSFGVDGSAAIINHPQVAILGVGRIIDRPWVVDGELAIRKLTQLSLVFDHRVCDGGTAAAFLRFVADAFENPASVFADL